MRFTFGNDYDTYDLRSEYNAERGFDNPRGYAWRELGDITDIVIHHSAFDPVDGALEAIARTAAYHKGKGWPGIGYHFALGEDGESYYVGDILTVRYHATALSNPRSIGIEVLGDFTSRSPSVVQMAGLATLVANLQFALGAHLPVRPHRSVVPTQCPGEGLVTAWRASCAVYGASVGWE